MPAERLLPRLDQEIIEGARNLRVGLAAYGKDRGKEHPMGLHGIIILTPQQLRDLEARLTLSDEKVTRRLAKLYSRYGPLALQRWVAGQLLEYGVKKEDVGRATLQFFAIVLSQPIRPEKGIEISPELSNLVPSLEAAFECLGKNDTHGSVDEQLGDLEHITTLGLAIHPRRKIDDPISHGFQLPVSLLEVLKSLKEPEAGTILEEWISLKLMGEKRQVDNCLKLIRNLISFSWVLDSEALLALYQTKEGKIVLYPFRALNDAVGAVRRFFKEYRGDPQITKELEEMERQIQLRFYEALAGTCQGLVEADAVKACKPDPVTLTQKYLHWVEEHPEEDPQTIIDFGLRLAEQSGYIALNLVDYLRGWGNKDLAKIVEREAQRRGLITLTKEDRKIKDAFIRETHDKLLANPWIDFMSHDFSKLIAADTENVVFICVTGTFGPCTLGHEKLFRYLTNYCSYQEKLEESGAEGRGKTQWFVVVLPITDLLGIAHKDPVVAGSIAERTASILLHLENFPRDRIFVSTQLQPDPASAKSTERAFNAVRAGIFTKLHQDLGGKSFINIVVRFAFGADELNYQRLPDGQLEMLPTQQPKKTKDCVLVVGRHGYLVPIINGAEIITNELPDMECILTPATGKISSTQAIGAVRTERPQGFFAAGAIPFILKHWSLAAESARLSVVTPPNIVPVENIHQGLVKEFDDFVKALKN